MLPERVIATPARGCRWNVDVPAPRTWTLVEGQGTAVGGEAANRVGLRPGTAGRLATNCAGSRGAAEDPGPSDHLPRPILGAKAWAVETVGGHDQLPGARADGDGVAVPKAGRAVGARARAGEVDEPRETLGGRATGRC